MGKIIYAADDHSFNLKRLQDYSRYYQLENQFKEISPQLIFLGNIPEYEAILVLLQQQIINSNQTRQIIKNIIEEILFNTLSLSKGDFSWEQNYNLQPQMVSFKIHSLLKKISYQLQLWQQYYPYIKSSTQCPVVKNDAKLRSILTKNTYLNLTIWMDGKTSLRKLARYLNKDLITITKTIYPWIEMGWLNLLNTSNQSPKIPEETTVIQPNIICITKDQNWAENLEIVFKQHNYSLSIINNSQEIFNIVLNNLPSLIIWEIEVLTSNDYELFRMLREYKTAQNIPIIFIVNQDNFLTKLKYQIAGATDYLSKTFFTENILDFIEKYI